MIQNIQQVLKCSHMTTLLASSQHTRRKRRRRETVEFKRGGIRTQANAKTKTLTIRFQEEKNSQRNFFTTTQTRLRRNFLLNAESRSLEIPEIRNLIQKKIKSSFENRSKLGQIIFF